MHTSQCPNLTKVALLIGLVLMLLTGTAFGQQRFDPVAEAAKTRQQQEMAPGQSAYVVKEGPIFGFSSLEVASKFVTKAERLSNKGLLRELGKLRKSGKIIDFKVDELVNAIRMDEKSGLVLVTKSLSPGEWWISGQFIKKSEKPGMGKPAEQSTRSDPVAETAQTRHQQEMKKEPAKSVEEEANEITKRFMEDSERAKKNQPPLMRAAGDGNLEMVNSLIAKGVDINATDGDGYTPLMYAAGSGGYLEIVKLLLDKGANINTKSADGETALTWASRSWTGEDRWREVLKLLLDKGADPNAKLQEGSTPLIYAVSNNDSEMVKLLIDKGANVNAKTENDWTALMSAVKTTPPRPHIVKLLIDKGANVNAKTTEGYTVLMQAVEPPVEGVSMEVVKLLLDSGADINARDIDGSTTLMSAVACLRGGLPLEVVKLLLDRGADVKARDNSGKTAFHEACGGHHSTRFEALDLLVSRGADSNDKYGDETPLTMAKIWGDKELLKWLAAHGVK